MTGLLILDCPLPIAIRRGETFPVLPPASPMSSIGNRQSAIGNPLFIPKGLNHSAQRCRDEGSATLGKARKIPSTLKELNPTPQVTFHLKFLI